MRLGHAGDRIAGATNNRYTRKEMATAYDLVRYAGKPFRQTHPDRLASMAILFGMEPAPAERCRVLELGCGDGGNLIPMAFESPNSEYVGIDLAAGGIHAGREVIGALGLSNIRLDQMDILDAGTELGTFDYVIAHGLYSWAPEAVRDKLMAMAGGHLAPQGVAYVSYNALPGCRIREMFRDMVLIHTAQWTEPEARLEGAREFLECAESAQESRGEMGLYLKSQARLLKEKPRAVLFHDEMGEIYYPVYFRDFVAHAARHGLRFLAEANYGDMLPGDLPPRAIALAERCSGGDRVVREQYFDFFKNRAFRQTLLCRAEVAVAEGPLAERVRRLYVSSRAKPVEGGFDVRSDVAVEFRTARGASMTAAHPMIKAAMLAMGRPWPEALSFEELLAAMETLVGVSPQLDAVADFLLKAYGSGLVEFHARRPQCVARVSEFPVASDLARWQAARSELIVSAHHTGIEATGEVERRLIALLDGTRDVAMLARELRSPAPVPEGPVAEQVQAALRKLAEMGVLRG